MRTDEELMVDYQNDDYAAFEILYARHRDKVYAYVKKRLFDQDAAEEVFQNIFLKLHKSRYQYQDQYLFLKWLYTVARSELYDFCKKKRIETVEIDEAKITEVVEDIDVDHLEKLSERERRVIELRYFEDREFDEISTLLDTTPSNIRKIVSRSLKKLRDFYSKRED
jgi:RNA polymerase sigma factor (sigma-70 family)